MLFGKVYKHAMKYPPFAYVVNLIQDWVKLSKNLVTHVLQDYHVRRFLDSFLAKTNFYVAAVFKVIDIMGNKRQLFSYTWEYKPEIGYFQHEQYLPIQWYAFTEVPQMIELFSSSSSESEIDINTFYINLMHTLRTFSAARETQTLLPPFSATALLIGNSQMITFDKTVFDFEGDCQYLLTKDFRKNRFSILANYKRRIRTGLTIYTEDQEIELLRDGRVYLNKKRTELPLIVHNSYVKQAGNRIVLFNKQGFIVDCNTVHSTCSITISGWYYGTTGGLLGVYDNEASNDFLASNRIVTQDVAEFAQSWQVGEKCGVNYTPVNQSTVPWDVKKCKSLFLNKESTLNLCFGVVDPKPFYTACLKFMESQTNFATTSSGFCQASAGYIENCRLNKISINIPMDCVQCEAPTRSYLPGGHNIRFPQVSSLQRRADIVFVVDKKACVQHIDIRMVVTLIESSLREDGFKDNEYALVGYGGSEELVDPHIYTSSSKIFTDSSGIISTFNRFTFIILIMIINFFIIFLI